MSETVIELEMRVFPITETEREAAFNLSVKLVQKGYSGPCICDHCIVRVWRPLIRQGVKP